MLKRPRPQKPPPKKLVRKTRANKPSFPQNLSETARSLCVGGTPFCFDDMSSESGYDLSTGSPLSTSGLWGQCSSIYRSLTGP